jgi:hypothetical protein
LVLFLSLSVYVLKPRGRAVLAERGAAPAVGALAPHPLLAALRDGDVICRLGDRLWSQWFTDVSVSDKRYSHVGIVRVTNDHATVIHSEGTAVPGKDAVKEESLEDFVRIARAVGVYRAKGVDGGLVSRTAAEYLGVPFDWHFDMEDESKLYCTELLHVVFRRIAPKTELGAVYIGALNKKVIPLESISNSDRFEEVCFIAAENK